MRYRTLAFALALASASPAIAQDRVVRDRAHQERWNLPAPVARTIESRWPGAEILDVDRDDGIYDIELRTRRGVRLDVDIRPNGRVVDVDVEGRDYDRDRWRARDDRHDRRRDRDDWDD